MCSSALVPRDEHPGAPCEGVGGGTARRQAWVTSFGEHGPCGAPSKGYGPTGGDAAHACVVPGPRAQVTRRLEQQLFDEVIARQLDEWEQLEARAAQEAFEHNSGCGGPGGGGPCACACDRLRTSAWCTAAALAAVPVPCVHAQQRRLCAARAPSRGACALPAHPAEAPVRCVPYQQSRLCAARAPSRGACALPLRPAEAPVRRPRAPSRDARAPRRVRAGALEQSLQGAGAASVICPVCMSAHLRMMHGHIACPRERWQLDVRREGCTLEGLRQQLEGAYQVCVCRVGPRLVQITRGV